VGCLGYVGLAINALLVERGSWLGKMRRNILWGVVGRVRLGLDSLAINDLWVR